MTALRFAALLLAAGTVDRAAPPDRARAPGVAGFAGADTVDLAVVATTDVHGHLRGWDYYAGRPDPAIGALSRAATVVDSLRRAEPGRVVLVDAGDMLQGTVLTDVAARGAASPHPVIAAMNAMQYDAAAVGNHEFNYGLPLVRRAAAEAHFPLLAANFVPSREESGGFEARTVVERAGVRVAIVGATTPGSMVWDREHLRGRATIGDVVPAVRREVEAARRAGADVVVAVLHSGLDEPSSYDTTSGLASENVAARVAREVSGIDLVVFGHSHQQLADTVIGGALVMQPKNWAASVAVAHLALVREPAGGTTAAAGRDANAAPARWRVVAKHASLVPTAGRAEDPAVLAATAAGHARAVAYAASPLGTTPVAWRADSARVADAAVTDFVLDVMRRRAGADLAATAVFATDAGFRAGAVTVADVARLYPYENTLRAVRVTGAQLRAFLEQAARYYTTDGTPDPRVPGFNYDVVAGAEYALDLSRPLGRRVAALRVRGRDVGDADTFTLALNSYRQGGGGGYGMLVGAPVVYDRGEGIRELLIDEVRRRRTLRPADYHAVNWHLEPAAAVAHAYRVTAPVVNVVNELRADPAAAAARGMHYVKADPPFASRLRVLGINDFHGAFEPRPDPQGVMRGGADALAAAVARARAECVAPACVSVLLDGGDEFQGTPASNLAFGRPIVAFYTLLGVDAAALGNHEFDWGRDTLAARVREEPYRTLAANVRDAAGKPLPGVGDDTLITRGALKIGVVGLATPETPQTTRAINVRGLTFAPMAPAADARIRALRARGANVVLVVAHSGAFCRSAPTRTAATGGSRADSAQAAREPAAEGGCTGEIIDFARALAEPVDAIVSGHTHTLVNTRVRGTPISQARTTGRALGIIDLPLDSTTGRPRAADARVEVREVVPDPASPPPPAVDSLVRRATAAVAERVNRPVATIAAAMPRDTTEQYALGNLVVDAQRWAGRGDVAVTNNGGLRADLQAGPATYGSLFEVQPFGNVLSRVSVRGRDLRAYFERLVSGRRPRVHVSGATLVYDPSRPAGSRLVSATLDGGRGGKAEPIVDDRLYTVVLNDFLVTGGDGLGLAAASAAVTPLTVVDLDALVGYLRQLPQPVRPPAGGRIRAAGSR